MESGGGPVYREGHSETFAKRPPLPNFFKEIIRVFEKRKGVDYCAEKMLP
jgi:hypothetical protein